MPTCQRNTSTQCAHARTQRLHPAPSAQYPNPVQHTPCTTRNGTQQPAGLGPKRPQMHSGQTKPPLVCLAHTKRRIHTSNAQATVQAANKAFLACCNPCTPKPSSCCCCFPLAQCWPTVRWRTPALLAVSLPSCSSPYHRLPRPPPPATSCSPLLFCTLQTVQPCPPRSSSPAPLPPCPLPLAAPRPRAGPPHGGAVQLEHEVGVAAEQLPHAIGRGLQHSVLQGTARGDSAGFLNGYKRTASLWAPAWGTWARHVGEAGGPPVVPEAGYPNRAIPNTRDMHGALVSFPYTHHSFSAVWPGPSAPSAPPFASKMNPQPWTSNHPPSAARTSSSVAAQQQTEISSVRDHALEWHHTSMAFRHPTPPGVI